MLPELAGAMRQRRTTAAIGRRQHSGDDLVLQHIHSSLGGGRASPSILTNLQRAFSSQP